MRTGTKTIFRTILENASFGHGRMFGVFPQKPIPVLTLVARIRAVNFELTQSGIRDNLGLPVTVPHRAATHAYYGLIAQNPGHLGMQAQNGNTTGTIETDVIKSMANLYREDPDRLKGYVTSGGSEGNLFALHLGQQSLAKHIAESRVALLLTPLTHYSVHKAARIMNVPVLTVPVDNAFGMDAQKFEDTIRRGYKRGYRGFLVALTAGYTETGTSDTIDPLAKRARVLMHEFTDLRVHMSLDASFSGLTLPFSSSGFAPFTNTMVQSVVTDFHKFGMVPFSAGVVLYRSRLLPRIARPIPYLPQMDTTLLGSRSGVPAAAIWSVIHALGRAGFAQLVERQVRHAELFLSLLKPQKTRIRVIHARESLIAGLILRGRLPEVLEERYWLHPSLGSGRIPGMERRDVLYPIHFMPHVTDKLIHRFVRDLMSVVT